MHLMRTLRPLLLVVSFALSTSAIAGGQESAAQAKPQDQTPAAAKAEDVKSLDTIVAALYDVISGPAGERNWSRFRSLFIPEARLIPTSKMAEGKITYRVLTPDDYVNRAGQSFIKQGFFENEIARRSEQFGNIAHVWTTYESRHAQGEQPFARGINSLQLFNDGARWWIIEIVWDSERPGSSIPSEYLPKK
jgi:hypothetical protein